MTMKKIQLISFLFAMALLCGYSFKSRYGTKKLTSLMMIGKFTSRFLTTTKRRENKNSKQIIAKVETVEEEEKDVTKSGSELRKSVRTRQALLRDVKANFKKTKMVPRKNTNFSIEKISQIIEVLNIICEKNIQKMVNDNDDDATVNLNEIIDLINWNEFHTKAYEIIDDYDDKTKRNIETWIRYHIEKNDIQLDDKEIIWDAHNRKMRSKRIRVFIE
jgi:hypothetical protein